MHESCQWPLITPPADGQQFSPAAAVSARPPATWRAGPDATDVSPAASFSAFHHIHSTNRAQETLHVIFSDAVQPGSASSCCPTVERHPRPLAMKLTLGPAPLL